MVRKGSGIAVEKLWPGETFVLLGCGPSLTQADVDYCRGRARIIAVNTAFRMAPFADVIYGADAIFWTAHKGVPGFTGLRYAVEKDAARWGVTVLGLTGAEGLELNPNALKTGQNSGYQALNLSVHLGAARVILLGYNMQQVKGREYFAGDDHTFKDRSSPYGDFLKRFYTIVKPLQSLGIEVINCTPDSALKCFPMMPLRQALAVHDQAVA